MSRILEFEADRQTLTITRNSWRVNAFLKDDKVIIEEINYLHIDEIISQLWFIN